jgi:endoglucanase
MGEYGAYRRDGSAHVPKDLATHNASVDYWITFVTKEALARGIKPFWWDAGGALDRRNNTVKTSAPLMPLSRAPIKRWCKTQ